MARRVPRLADRVVLVTGAGAGIGRETCVRLAEEGAIVVVTSRTQANVEATCQAVEASTGKRPLGIQVDVADSGAVDAAWERASGEYGRIDVLVANAGVKLIPGPSVTDTSDADWRGVMRVNVDGVFHACRAALRHMPDGGAIVTVGSINSLMAAPNDVAYTTSKGAVLQLTRAVALDAAARGIRANCVCPGAIDTPLAGQFFTRAEDPDALRAEFAALAPLNRMGTPREIANCILFLASDEASFLTGAAIVADGGTTARF